MTVHPSSAPAAASRPGQHALDTLRIPTCASGVVVATLTAVVLAAASLCGLAAYRRPVVQAVMLTSTARPPTPDVPAPTMAPIEEDSMVDLDVLVRAAERPESAAVEPDATTGVLALPSAAEGHRVWVDGHLIQVVSSRTAIACGRHIVKIGSRGHEQQVVVPCGADVFVSYP